MKYVVDISEQRYRSLQECAVAVTDEIHKAVLNGKPYEECKKGRWIDVYKDRYQGLHPPVFTCSICNKGYYRNVIGMYYCPICGAKMEGEDK